MGIYLDNAATTSLYKEAEQIMSKAALQDYGNPSSMHYMGVVAEQYVKEAAKTIADILKVSAKELVFTSGGTESNNLALIGAALANQRAGKHIITTNFEHPSVYNPLLFLEEFGFSISFLEVDSQGHISLEQLQNLICEDTILVSVMYVNNELGAVADVAAIAKTIHEKNPEILFHVDAIQAFGKYKINPKKEGIDLLSVSGHKIHGPKGTGFLYIREKCKVRPLMLGGGHQNNMRSGTLNVPGIAGIGAAASLMYKNLEKNRKHMYSLKQYFVSELIKMEGVTVNAVSYDRLTGNVIAEAIEATAPHVVSASFADVRSEVLLHALEGKGIYVSAGSACASNHPAISGTLKAIGLEPALLESTIRFSFVPETSQEELDTALQALHELLPVLRKFTRK